MEATQHDLDTLKDNPSWFVLSRQRPPHDKDWLRTNEALPNCPSSRPAGQHCDEFPYAATVHGGQANHPNLKLMNALDNTNPGTHLNSRFYVPCSINDRSKRLFVLPVPDPAVPTFGICPR
jgi:hypothetical protein